MISEKLKKEIIELRRYFHMYPELSQKEENTTRKIREELSKSGIKFYEVDEVTTVGVVGEGEKKIAIRGDIDALPMEEKTDLEYKSKNKGAMHSCGHDGHTAILLGVSKYLKEIEKDLNGKVYLCFQSGEEIGKGAVEVLEFLEKEGGVDEVVALHLWSLIPVGKICVEPGPRMAAGDSFKIKVVGKGGHGSRPDQCVNPLKIASQILLEISAIPSNRISTLENSVVSIGKISGGTARNIIPQEATIEGGFRTFSKEAREKIPEQIKLISEGIAKINGGRVEVEIDRGVPPVVNDVDSARRAKKVVEETLGKEGVYPFELICASENYGMYTEKYKGLMAFVGAGNVDEGIIQPHHHQEFKIDEKSLENGTAFFIKYVEEFFKES